MNIIYFNTVAQCYGSTKDFEGPEFQQRFDEAYCSSHYDIYCPCMGTGTDRVKLELFRRNGIIHLRHKKHKPHNPNCPLYLVPGRGGSADDLTAVQAEDLLDELGITQGTFLQRSEAIRFALAQVARRSHDRLAWNSFASGNSLVCWHEFVREVRDTFYNLPAISPSGKSYGKVQDWLTELGLNFIVGTLRDTKPPNGLSRTSEHIGHLYIRPNSSENCNGHSFQARVATVRGALDYCQIFNHCVSPPYLLLGLAYSNFEISRCVLLPIYAIGERFCLAESHEERLLLNTLLGLGIHNWVKPADPGTWSDHPLATRIFNQAQVAGKPPRMDVLAKVGDKLVIIEHFGLDYPEYRRLRQAKLQFAYRNYLPGGIYYWDSVFTPDQAKRESGNSEGGFQIHEYQPGDYHHIFKLKDIDSSKYQA